MIKLKYFRELIYKIEEAIQEKKNKKWID
jgi:hypothetical protein